jgi:flagellar biosynthetic protein FliP
MDPSRQAADAGGMTSSLTPTSGILRSWWPLAKHYVEMVIAMFAGMLAIGMLRSAAGLTVEFADRPGTSYVLMATDMSIGMAAWMRFRRHTWASTLEMCAAMYVPAVLLPLVWADLMSPMAFMVTAHVVMMVAMLVVLVRRRHEMHCS